MGDISSDDAIFPWRKYAEILRVIFAISQIDTLVQQRAGTVSKAGIFDLAPFPRPNKRE
jgi:hypothetical protein